VYKPSVQDVNLLEPIKALIDKLDKSNLPFLLVGDFNLPGIDWHSGTATSNFMQNDFLDAFNKYGLYQKVLQPTRGRNILDLVFGNEPHLVKNLQVVPPLSGSDHNTVEFYLNICYAASTGNVDCNRRAWHSADNMGATEDLQRIDWQVSFSKCKNMEDLWATFAYEMNQIITARVPLHRPSTRKPTYPKHIRKMIVKKRRIHRKLDLSTYSNADRQNHLDELANRLNQTDELIKHEIFQYAKGKEERFLQTAKGDQRKFFSYASSKLRSKPRIAALRGPHGLSFDDATKAQLLSDQYKSVFVTDQHTNVYEDAILPRTCTLNYILFTEEKVERALKLCSASVAAGPDGFPPCFLKRVATGACIPLAIIFQHSMETASLPTEWLCGNVVPCYKGKGNDSDTSAYRPISLTSSPCKVMERIVKEEITEFLLRENVISKNQHGFLRKRSTQTQLLECLNDWTQIIDAHEYVDVLYIDIAKAFDTVSHSILLYKLAKVGIRGKLLAWIKSFLTKRSQVVMVGSHRSSSESVISGVPQGSVLGPLLFLIFINDIVHVINHCGIKIFADDTKIYFKVKRDLDHDKFTYDVRKIFGWAHKNRLIVAMQKCEILHIGARNPCRPLYVDGMLLDETRSTKDLGIIMSGTLHFKEHIHTITQAAYQRSGLIFRCFISRESHFLVKMFTAFCRPKLEFNTCVWSPHQLNEIVMVENVQRRFTKRINGLTDLTYADRLRRLGLQSLEYRRLVFDLCMVFSICNKLVDLEFNDFFTPARTRSTRGHEWKLVVPSANSNVRKYFFANRVVPVWNSLPNEVVTSPTISSFKSRLGKISLDNFLKYPEFNVVDQE
jgi:hypothetical protein